MAGGGKRAWHTLFAYAPLVTNILHTTSATESSVYLLKGHTTKLYKCDTFGHFLSQKQYRFDVQYWLTSKDKIVLVMYHITFNWNG